MHRSNVHTSAGITIEFQNSPISFEEIERRTIFYPKIIWVVNAGRFAGNLTISKTIPDAKSKEMEPFELIGDDDYSRNLVFAKKGDLPHGPLIVKYLGIDHPELKETKTLLEKNGFNFRFLTLRSKRTGWLGCT